MVFPWKSVFIDMVEERISRIIWYFRYPLVPLLPPQHMVSLHFAELVIAPMNMLKILYLAEVKLLLVEWSQKVETARRSSTVDTI